MFQFDTLIVGGGLFGKITADALKAQGQRVIIIDESHEHAGSKPAACLMKPSWFSSLGHDVYEPSLKLLDELYGVQDLQFAVGKTVPATVHWVDPAKILTVTDRHRFLSAFHDGQFWMCDIEHLSPHFAAKRSTFMARNLIVAAGIWTNEVLEKIKGVQYRVPGLKAQYGVSFYTPGQIAKPFIQPWAPYRQLVAFNIQPDTVWVGDGTALSELSAERVEQCRERCFEALPSEPEVHVQRIGARPYVKGVKPALLEDLERGLYVLTGGAKNGTLAAGYCAAKLREMVK